MAINKETIVSLKDQAGFVKEALSGDEKILENAFKLERIYKKHKLKIWAVVIVLIVVFGGNALMKMYQEGKLRSANDAFLTLQQKPDDSSAKKALKENNSKLFELFTYAQAVKSGDTKTLETLTSSSDSLISDVSKYHKAVLSNQAVDSAYYQDFVLVEEAFDALKGGKKDIAKQKLSLIGENSPLRDVARLLKHYTLEVK